MVERTPSFRPEGRRLDEEEAMTHQWSECYAERLSDLDDQRSCSGRHPFARVQTTLGKDIPSTFC